MEEIRLSKKEIQNRLNTLRIKPKGLELRKYGVTTKYFIKDETQWNKRVDYEATVSMNINNGIGEIEIHKENIFYNQHEPDWVNEILANAITKSLYPIRTHISEKGISSNEIINHSEIIKRWHSEKNTIYAKYASNDLDDFFEVTENTFTDKIKLERNLQHDWFWNLFFHPKFINYGDKRTAETDLYLAVIPYHSPVAFSGIQKIDKIPTDYHSFQITFQSHEKEAPMYFHPKNWKEEDNVFISLQVSFDCDLYHHFPMHTIANLEVYSKNWKGEKESISRTLFTMYQQNTKEYENKFLSADSPFITGGLVKLPPNKWGFDNFEKLENDW